MLRTAFLISVLLCLLGVTGHCANVGDLKARASGSMVQIDSTAITFLEPTECYIEAADRSSAIRVQADTTGFAIGDVVTVTGTIGIEDSERVIQNATLQHASGQQMIAPVGMKGKWIGGAIHSDIASLQDWIPYRIPGDGIGWRWEVTPGLCNTGLLVKTWGTVNAVCYSPITDTHWFHVDDGSGVVGDYGDSGIIVYSDADVSEGDFVTVTGLSSIETALDDETRLVRVIRPRTSEDVKTEKEYENLKYPFSDEFEATTLDPRWIVSRAAECSLASVPGSLVLSGSYANGEYPAIAQLVPGDWDMETKLRVNAAPSASYTVGFSMEERILRPNGPATAYLASVLDSGNGCDPVVRLLGTADFPVSGEWIWIKARMRRPSIFVSVSFDGANYSQEYSSDPNLAYIRINASNYPPGASPLVIDYIRFTRVDQ